MIGILQQTMEQKMKPFIFVDHHRRMQEIKYQVLPRQKNHTMFGGMLNNKNLKIQYVNNRLDSYMSFKQSGRSIIYRLFNCNKQEEHYMEEKRNEQRQQRKL